MQLEGLSALCKGNKLQIPVIQQDAGVALLLEGLLNLATISTGF